MSRVIAKYLNCAETISGNCYALCRKFEFKKTLSMKRSSNVAPTNGISRYLTVSNNSNIQVGLHFDRLSRQLKYVN